MSKQTENTQSDNPVTSVIKQAAEEIDALPSNRREAIWIALWNGVLISFLVFFLEYAVWSPLWNHVILPGFRHLAAFD